MIEQNDVPNVGPSLYRVGFGSQSRWSEWIMLKTSPLKRQLLLRLNYATRICGVISLILYSENAWMPCKGHIKIARN